MQPEGFFHDTTGTSVSLLAHHLPTVFSGQGSCIWPQTIFPHHSLQSTLPRDFLAHMEEVGKSRVECGHFPMGHVPDSLWLYGMKKGR